MQRNRREVRLTQKPLSHVPDLKGVVMQAHSDHSDEPGGWEVKGRLWILQEESRCFLEEAVVLQSGDSCQLISLTFPSGPPEPMT